MARGRGIRAAPTTLSRTPEGERPEVRRRVYRAGGTDKATDYGPAHELFVRADALRPDDREGRLEGLFCSAQMEGLARWVRGSAGAGPMYDPTPIEISYEGPEPFAYPVLAWDVASSKGTDEALRAYWATGLSLSEYERAHASGELPPIWRDGGELLVSPRFITSSRGVSLARLSRGLPDFEAGELRRIWKRYLGRSR
ncbi:hypothetical protein [Miltoncostaea oceani]|uniref:hypothetical protein n=1 Tax=Miltoncostaea oceani TaxID=2843216 RepID=UPI001C3E0AA6|nr:hypothetical protein [Miltoncostaea oceani]